MNNDFDKSTVELCRINVKLEKNIKEWLSWHSKTMGMSMSQLISFLVTQYCLEHQQKDAMVEISKVARDPDFVGDNTKLVEFMSNLLQNYEEHK